MTSWLDFWIGFGTGILALIAAGFILGGIGAYLEEKENRDRSL